MIKKLANICFYVALVIEILIVLIDKSAYVNPIEGRLFQLTFLLFSIKMIFTKYTKREYIFILLMLLLGAVSYFVTGRNELVRFAVFIAACKNVDVQSSLKLVFYMTLAGSMTIILLSLTGVYGATVLVQEYGRGGVETRYTLGMGHPNALQCMIFVITTLGLYLYATKMKIYGYLGLLMINTIFFMLTDSKTGYAISVCAIVMAFVFAKIKSEQVLKLCGMVDMVLLISSILVSILIACSARKVYDYDWSLDRGAYAQFWSKVNHALNGRIRILTSTENWHGDISSWGLFSKAENNYFFDLGWIRLLYWYGIIPGMIIVILFILLAVYCLQKKDYMAIVMMTAFSIYTITEAHTISVYLARNYVLFIAGGYWYQMLGEKWKYARGTADIL